MATAGFFRLIRLIRTFKDEGRTVGTLKELIDQLEEEYGPGNTQPLPLIDDREPEAPLPVVISSDGQVLAWSTDPSHIRVYAWALQTLRFVLVDAQTSQILKIPSGEMDIPRIRKLAAELRMTEREVQGGLDRLVAEGDLEFKTERGRRIYQLAPLRY